MFLGIVAILLGIVGFGAATGENDLLRLAIEQCSHLCTGLLHGCPCLLPELMEELEASPSVAYLPGIVEEFSRRHEDKPEVVTQTLLNLFSDFFLTKQATYEDIANNDFDLTPKRYLPFYSAFGQGAVESFEEESNRTVLIAEEATTTANTIGS